MTNQEIITQILAHHQQCGGGARQFWYVGIASDPHDRLFVGHSVSKENGAWIIREASSEYDARAIESHLIDRYSFDGDTGGGDETTRFVYAYRKTDETTE